MISRALKTLEISFLGVYHLLSEVSQKKYSWTGDYRLNN